MVSEHMQSGRCQCMSRSRNLNVNAQKHAVKGGGSRRRRRGARERRALSGLSQDVMVRVTMAAVVSRSPWTCQIRPHRVVAQRFERPIGRSP